MTRIPVAGTQPIPVPAAREQAISEAGPDDGRRAAQTVTEANSGNGRQATPRATHVVGEPVVFDGYVDDFENNIAAMQFSLDDGATWTTYQTQGVTADKGVNWHFSYTPTRPGRYLLKARAVDGAGNASALVASYAFEVQP